MNNIIPFPVNPRASRADVYRPESAFADENPFRLGDRLLLKRGGRAPSCIPVTIVDTWMRGIYAEDRTYMARGNDGTMYLTTGEHLSYPQAEAGTP